MLAPLSIEYRSVDSIVGYARNAREHSEGQIGEIAASIRTFGFANPILVSETGEIVAGHGRHAAAKLLGLTEVPVIVLAGLSDIERRQLILADNRIALNAGWNADMLRLELGDLHAAGADLQVLGFSDDELAKALGQPGRTDPDDAPPAERVAITRRGDLWVCGNHRLLCGDSTDAGDVTKLLGGVRPHLMVTDPPYGVEYDPSWRARFGSTGIATGKVENDDRADWRETWRLFPGDVAYVWHGALHNVAVAESLIAAGFDLRSQIIWVKTRAPISRGHYHWQHEPAFYAEREPATLESNGDDPGLEGWGVDHDNAVYVVRAGKTAQWRGGRKQSTTWFIEHLKNDTGHGTQKPVECMRRPIANNSSAGQAVYEPFCGSGTTMIAAEIEGRHAYCMELSPIYCDVIVKRWEAFTGRAATHALDGRDFGVIGVERAGGGNG